MEKQSASLLARRFFHMTSKEIESKAARPAGATRVANISEDCESAGGAEQSAFRRTIIWRKEDIGRDNEKKVFSFDDFDVSYFIFGSLSGNDFNGTSPVDFDKN